MTTWLLLAPGPSARPVTTDLPIGAVGNAFELAPQARFIAHSDAAWWRHHPQAKARDCLKYVMGTAPDVERINIPEIGSTVNSGVLALECAYRLGATRILLSGFDMYGTHFFGKYTNGLRNTQPHQRHQHLKQYEAWARLRTTAYRKDGIEVWNVTSGSALMTFPTARLEDFLYEL